MQLLSYNISKLEVNNINIEIQAELHDKRGEHELAAHLRGIVVDEAVRLRKIESAKRKAENVVLMDSDR